MQNRRSWIQLCRLRRAALARARAPVTAAVAGGGDTSSRLAALRGTFRGVEGAHVSGDPVVVEHKRGHFTIIGNEHVLQETALLLQPDQFAEASSSLAIKVEVLQEE
jgi:hypothetical protein